MHSIVSQQWIILQSWSRSLMRVSHPHSQSCRTLIDERHFNDFLPSFSLHFMARFPGVVFLFLLFLSEVIFTGIYEWGMVSYKIQEPQNVANSEQQLRNVWQNVSNDEIRYCYHSFPRYIGTWEESRELLIWIFSAPEIHWKIPPL